MWAYGILYRKADAKEDGAHPLFGVRAVLWRKEMKTNQSVSRYPDELAGGTGSAFQIATPRFFSRRLSAIIAMNSELVGLPREFCTV